MEEHGVLCEVETEFLRLAPINCIPGFDVRAMAVAVRHRPLTVETWARSQASPCKIYGGQSGTVTGFSPSTSVFPCHYHFTNAPYSSSS
jgi:hypothetical protein